MSALPYVLLGFAALVLGLQGWAVWRAKRSEGRPAPEYLALLPQAAQGFDRHLFYFYGEHCGPCRALMPVIERLRESHPNLVKLDVAEHADAAHRFGVMGTPTFVLVEQGKVAKVILGAAGEKKILELLREGS